MNMLYVVAGCAAAALLCAIWLYQSIIRTKVNDETMDRISSHIRKGAMAYLKRQYKVLAVFVVIMAVLLAVIPGLGWQMSVCFLAGALLSALAGFFGMRAATAANVRTAQAAQQGTAPALRMAFSGGAVMGLSVVGFGALGIALVYAWTKDASIATAFGFGASSIALFCRVGGGIYTKAADVGADLVGKVEEGIPEDDPRNPAVIADNVGDNVGDVAGMGSDLFESYVGAILSAILLGLNLFGETGLNYVLLTVAAGILASVIGVLVTRCARGQNVSRSLNLGTYVSIVLILGASAVLSVALSGGWAMFGAVACGVIAGAAIGKVTEFYTSDAYRSVKHIANQSSTGPATNILSGMGVGLRSTAAPILILCAALLVSYEVCGLFGLALAALGMLSTIGVIVSVDAYGPVADNAGGIAEMAHMDESVRKITDQLDSVGNTTAAIGKGFSIGSAALTAVALFTSYTQAVGLTGGVNLLEPKVLAGMFVGAMLAHLFGAMTIEAVSRAAQKMIDEVRRQFRERPGIMAGTEEPDYSTCVDISTRAALKEMILPGLLAIACPIAMGLLLGAEALAGLLLGSTVSGVLLAVWMANAGGAWDNAKKFIEAGNHGGKGSDSHHAGVIGDTVGDPLKDTAGPSMNILIKLMSIVALVFVPLFL